MSMSPTSRCQNRKEKKLAALYDLFHLKQKGLGEIRCHCKALFQNQLRHQDGNVLLLCLTPAGPVSRAWSDGGCGFSKHGSLWKPQIPSWARSEPTSEAESVLCP